MKSLKLFTAIILFCVCSSYAQVTPTATPAPATPATQQNPPLKQANGQMQNQPGQQPMVAGQPAPKMNRYMVTIPHTKEQCQSVMSQMKEKGAPMMMRFDWGCNSGEHVGYALMAGMSDDVVRKQLPEGVQKMAKVTKVEKANAGQMDQMHK